MSQPPPSHLMLFNYWQLIYDHQAILVPSRSQRLVALLALRGRQNRARLAGTLWPDVAEPRAHASLRAAISVLNRRLPGLIAKDQSDVFLSETVTVDVAEFRACAAQVLSAQLPDPVIALEHSAISGGELLPGWYDDWVLVDQERIHQLRLHVLEALADALVARGAYPHALQAALQAVAIDPLRESARRSVITVHLAQGNTADAVREYRRFRSLLRDELGVAPTRHMIELVRRFGEHLPA